MNKQRAYLDSPYSCESNMTRVSLCCEDAFNITRKIEGWVFLNVVVHTMSTYFPRATSIRYHTARFESAALLNRKADQNEINRGARNNVLQVRCLRCLNFS